MNAQFMITDQAALSFLSQQAAAIETEVYRVQFEEIDYTAMVDIDTSAGMYAKTVEHYTSVGTGKAKWVDENATDLALANTDRTKHTHKIHMAGVGYGYNNWELGYAQRLGIALDVEDAITARRLYEEFIDDITKVGDTTKGMTGLYNDANVTAGNVAGADATARLWSTKTGADILLDMNEAVTSIMTTTLRVEKPNMLLMDVSKYRLAATKLIGNDNASGDTALTMFRKQNPDIDVRAVGGLNTAGASGVSRMIAFRKARDVVKLHLPMPLMFGNPLQVGHMNYEVPGFWRTGGVEIRKPGAFRYRDGI